jgi:putative ABC transport system permease protein
MTLIASSVIIYNQLEFMQKKAMGYNAEEVIVLPVKNLDAINPRFEELRSELLKISNVKSVSAASNIPGRPFNQNPVFATQHPEMRVASSEALIDYDFFNLMDIKFADGRPFSKENPADREAFILNETAAKNLYAGNAVGKEFSWDFDEGIVQGTVIGVVKDFHFQSLHEPIRPLLFRLMPYYNYVLIKVNTGEFSGTLNAIENTWKKFDNRFAFEFSFLSNFLNQQYQFEQSMARVLGAFSFIAITIACFGLLAIASLTFKQKTREVSVRKVLGATLAQIMILLIRDFTRLVIIAVLLATPIIWWIMSSWLENFTFRTTINPLIFVGSGVLLVAIAWATLSYLLWKISMVNPAETLKNE